MKIMIRSIEDLLSGLLFLVIGLAACSVAYHYPLGTLARMGPGMLPLMLGGVLSLIGTGVCFQSLSFSAEPRHANGPSSEPRWSAGEARRIIRPLFFVLLGLGAFAFLVRPLGLFLAIVALVKIVAQADKGFPVKLALLLGPLLALFAVGIFVYGLGLPFPVWW